MGGNRNIVRGDIPIRPIVSSGTPTDKTMVAPTVSGFSGMSGFSAYSGNFSGVWSGFSAQNWWSASSGFSGDYYVWYSPADSGTHNGTWGPLSKNYMTGNLAHGAFTVGSSGHAGDYSDSWGGTSQQLINGSTQVISSTADMSVGLSTIPDPYSVSPVIASHTTYREGRNHEGGNWVGGFLSAISDPKMQYWQPNSKYSLSALKITTDDGGSTVSVSNIWLDWGRNDGAGFITLCSVPIPGLLRCSYGSIKSGSGGIAMSTAEISPVWAGQATHTQLRWSVGYVAPGDIYTTFSSINVEIVCIMPVNANYRIDKFTGLSNLLGVGRSVDGETIIRNPINLKPLANSYCFSALTDSITYTSLHGPGNGIGAQHTTCGGVLYASNIFGYIYQDLELDARFNFPTTLVTEEFARATVAGTGSGVTLDSGSEILEYYYHCPISEDLGNVLISSLSGTGSISSDRYLSSSGFSSLKYVYDFIDTDVDPVYTRGYIYTPMPDFLLESS